MLCLYDSQILIEAPPQISALFSSKYAPIVEMFWKNVNCRDVWENCISTTISQHLDKIASSCQFSFESFSNKFSLLVAEVVWNIILGENLPSGAIDCMEQLASLEINCADIEQQKTERKRLLVLIEIAVSNALLLRGVEYDEDGDEATNVSISSHSFLKLLLSHQKEIFEAEKKDDEDEASSKKEVNRDWELFLDRVGECSQSGNCGAPVLSSATYLSELIYYSIMDSERGLFVSLVQQTRTLLCSLMSDASEGGVVVTGRRKLAQFLTERFHDVPCSPCPCSSPIDEGGTGDSMSDCVIGTALSESNDGESAGNKDHRTTAEALAELMFRVEVEGGAPKLGESNPSRQDNLGKGWWNLGAAVMMVPVPSLAVCSSHPFPRLLWSSVVIGSCAEGAESSAVASLTSLKFVPGAAGAEVVGEATEGESQSSLEERFPALKTPPPFPQSSYAEFILGAVRGARRRTATRSKCRVRYTVERRVVHSSQPPHSNIVGAPSSFFALDFFSFLSLLLVKTGVKTWITKLQIVSQHPSQGVASYPMVRLLGRVDRAGTEPGRDYGQGRRAVSTVRRERSRVR